MTPDETYWDFCSRGELRLQRCSECSAWQFPPSGRCRRCLSAAMTWEPVSGRAEVWSWLRMHRRYFDDPAFTPPYTVAMVRLEEGPRLISSVRGADTLRSGAPLRLVFDDALDSSGRRLPRFELTEPGEA